MSPERNPLDLNNLPHEEFCRDGKQVLEGSSSSSGGGYRKKKNGGKEDCGKVYECRFCSLKFCKSQALGGHMNRHRQERETETLNRARQLVFNNDNIIPPHHLGCPPIPHGGGYHQSTNIGDPTLSYRPPPPPSLYPTRLFSGNSTTTLLPPPPPHQPSYMYASPPRMVSFSSHQYPAQTNDYFLGHVLSGSNTHSTSTTNNFMGSSALGPDHSNNNNNNNNNNSNNYTCIGAPIGHGLGLGNNGGSSSGKQQHLDRFQDGF